jgi:predicted nucleotide-binding protein (sugar kinase/HSP70/actin superfamily)
VGTLREVSVGLAMLTRSVLTSLWILCLCLPVSAETLSGTIDLGSDPNVNGIVHILEDTQDNRLALERMAKAIERSDFQRRQLRTRTTANSEQALREMNQVQARLLGQVNRLVSMAINRESTSAPVASGSFQVDVPFNRQLVLVIAQDDQRIGWWLQGTINGLPLGLAKENALLVRELNSPDPTSQP